MQNREYLMQQWKKLKKFHVFDLLSGLPNMITSALFQVLMGKKNKAINNISLA